MRYLGLYFLIFLFFLSGCLTSTFVANDALLQPWSTKLETQEPYTYPYAALYKKRGKTLIYVAARHEVSTNSPTFRLVKKTFETFSPNILILEGLAPDQPMDRMVFFAEDCVKRDFQSCGENFYAIHLVHKTKSTFISGEPPDEDILKSIVQKGYEHKELILFYFLRQIPQMKREGSLQKDHFANQANTYLAQRAKKLHVDSKIDFTDFQLWYQQKMNKEFVLDEINTEVPAPRYDGTYMQKFSQHVEDMRDSMIIKKIAKSLNEQETVMVVYGGSHLSVQRQALEAMLGKPVSYYLP